MDKKIPYRQGWLDGACGIYSIVNAYQTLYSTSLKEDEFLFREILEFLDHKNILKKGFWDGLVFKNMKMVINEVFPKRTY